MASHYDKENIYFFRISYLLHEEGTKAMRSFFLKAAGGLEPEEFNNYVVEKFVNEETCRQKLRVFQDQSESLFPKGGADINKLDISLLFTLIKHSFEGKGINKSDWTGKTTPGDPKLANIILLTIFRNNFAHSYSSRMTQDDFTTEWSKLSKILQELGVDKQEIDLCANKQFDNTDIQKIECLYLEISYDDYRKFITDFEQWYGQRELLNRLQVLLLEHFPKDEALQTVPGTLELLRLLTDKGLLNRTNHSVLYDAIKVTEQFGFKPKIIEKLPAFKDIKNRKVVTFSEHTLAIFDLGKYLNAAKIKKLDGRYNFPVLKKYPDSWSLILDFVPRGLLDKDKMDEVNEMLEER
ncbi:uncharacterized protein [Antedon mediterranea]|uniref:uncharacterized protein n=1 Tax=Antedon mediterranea TaxID=105859 RepID=UPI003AF6D14A